MFAVVLCFHLEIHSFALVMSLQSVIRHRGSYFHSTEVNKIRVKNAVVY